MGYSIEKIREEAGKRRPWKVHPVWRGIGCFMAILIPIMAWAGAIVMISTMTPCSNSRTVSTSRSSFKLTEYDWLNQVILWLNANLGGRGLTLCPGGIFGWYLCWWDFWCW